MSSTTKLPSGSSVASSPSTATESLRKVCQSTPPVPTHFSEVFSHCNSVSRSMSQLTNTSGSRVVGTSSLTDRYDTTSSLFDYLTISFGELSSGSLAIRKCIKHWWRRRRRQDARLACCSTSRRRQRCSEEDRRGRADGAFGWSRHWCRKRAYPI